MVERFFGGRQDGKRYEVAFDSVRWSRGSPLGLCEIEGN